MKPMNAARAEALRLGHTSYEFQPCPRCGATKRYTKSGDCFECQKRHRKTESGRKRNNPGRVKDRKRFRDQQAALGGYHAAPCESHCPPRPAECQCCGKPAELLCLDHDHLTGHFRGWLCDRCNRGIGALGDDLNGVMDAARYLKRAAALPAYGFVNLDWE